MRESTNKKTIKKIEENDEHDLYLRLYSVNESWLFAQKRKLLFRDS